MVYRGKVAQIRVWLAAGVSLLPLLATAQSAPELQEIVVTATKHTEEISKVPISIAAYSDDALQQSGVKSFGDLSALTPGVEFDNSAGFGPGTLTNVAIRGINSTVGSSTTGIYIDDTPVQSRITALSYFGNPLPLMFDVDRVEVERGPQGTLFGAGAEGGAVRFISPVASLDSYSGTARAELSATEGGGPSYEAGLAVGGPIAEGKLGFRSSAWYRSDGGYVDRVDPLSGATVDANANSSLSYALRNALTFKPNDWLTVTPSVYDQMVRTHDSSAYFEYLSDPNAGTFRNGRLLRQPSSDSMVLPSLKIEGDFGPATLTSVTSYLFRSGRVEDDLTSFLGALFGSFVSYGNPAGPVYPAAASNAAPERVTTTLRQISQETRLASNGPGRFSWTVGLYYSHTTQEDAQAAFSSFYETNFFGLPASAPTFASSLTSTDDQIALFGQADYKLTDSLTLTAGLRAARTDAKYAQSQSGPSAVGAPPFASGSLSESPVTPKVGLSWQIDPTDMIYASAAEGYRIGGGNQPIPLQSAANPAGCPLSAEPAPFASDKVWSYELGTKDRFFGNRLSVDGSLFHVDWSNIQQNVFLAQCGFGFISNTGQAVSNGFNFAGQLLATDNLQLGLSLAYTDAHITKDYSFQGSPIVQAGDAVGTPPMVNSPWDVTVSLMYYFGLFGQDAYFRAEDIYHSRNGGPFNSFIAGSPVYNPSIPPNPATNQLNLRTGISYGKSDISLFVNNALNSHPALGRYQDIYGATLFTDTTFRPLTVGLTANYKF